MDLQGKIEKFNVPEIFQLISSGRRTGTLGINHDEQSVIVYFKDGQVTYAYSPNRRNRLGDRLVARGVIEPKTLELSLKIQKESGGNKRLGAILIEKQYVDQNEIELTLKEQICDTVFRLMTWDRGVFKFYDGRFPTQEDVTLALSTENLILEGARRADEMNRLKEKLPEFSARLQLKLVLDDRQIELKLSAADWNTLSLCDSRRSIGKVLSDSGIDPVLTLKSIVKLMATGLIEPMGQNEIEIPENELQSLEDKIDSLSDLLNKFSERA